MIRTIVGTVTAILLAMLVITLIEGIGHAVWPPPPGFDLTGAQDTDALTKAMPLAALIAVPVGWFLGTLAGGFTGNLIAGRTLPGWIVACIILAASAYMQFLIPHPWWMVGAGLVAGPLGGWIATKAVRRALPA